MRQPDLFGAASAFPEGFRFAEEAISAAREAEIIRDIAPLPFKEFEFRGYEGKRRVVSFGWKYDFTVQKLLAAEPIPDFLSRLCADIAEATGFPFRNLAQVLVTEYAAGAGIGWHKDRPVFEDVMGVSLGSACSFRLRQRHGEKWRRLTLDAPPRSTYFMAGPVRWDWEHSIPPVAALRYSITFRTMRAGERAGALPV